MKDEELEKLREELWQARVSLEDKTITEDEGDKRLQIFIVKKRQFKQAKGML